MPDTVTHNGQVYARMGRDHYCPDYQYGTTWWYRQLGGEGRVRACIYYGRVVVIG